MSVVDGTTPHIASLSQEQRGDVLFLAQ